jgi:23S rRNA pseudouridine2605 synthase
MADKSTPDGERIAKVLSRRGVASRREAERLIEAGEVKVNGRTITSAALNVTAADRITISGHPLPEEEPARLWLYYKPEGLVTSAADEKGRDTVFDHLPEDMPRVMSVGRLDLNSEGLLLLTNDGELKRRLELPSTGWLRKYRVRVNGTPTDPDLEPLRRGITVDGERFQPMHVVLDRVQGANAWLTVGLREGKNREIRRAMNEIGLYVNRLIRISYGPFRLGDLQPGEVEEVRAKVLREQLGEGADEAAGAAPRKPAPHKPAPRKSAPATPAAARPASGRPPSAKPSEGALKALSASWQKATTPRGGRTRPELDSEDPTRKPRSTTGRAAGRTTGGATGTRRTAAPAAERPDTAPRKPRSPASGTPAARGAATDKPARSTSARSTSARPPSARGPADDSAPRSRKPAGAPDASHGAAAAKPARTAAKRPPSTRNQPPETSAPPRGKAPAPPRAPSGRKPAGDGPRPPPKRGR